MKKGLMLTLLGVIVFATFLVIKAPAGLLVSAVESNTPARLKGVSGTVWHGAARELTVADLTLGPLNWRVHPGALWRGELGLTLTLTTPPPAPHGVTEVSLSLFSDTLSLHDTDLTAGAGWILRQAAVPLDADGRFQLRIDSATLRPGRPPRLSARLDWREAAATYPRRYPLGAYTMTLQHRPENDPDHILGEFKDIDSPLSINGTVTLQADGQYRLDADIGTTPDAPRELKRMLPLLGDVRPDGSVRLQRRGNIRAFL